MRYGGKLKTLLGGNSKISQKKRSRKIQEASHRQQKEYLNEHKTSKIKEQGLGKISQARMRTNREK